MKKLFLGLFGFFMLAAVFPADAAIPWWLQPTICQINPSKCYATMGNGFDSDVWDVTSGCRGKKYICPEALTGSFTSPQTMSKVEIASGAGISSDFDVGTLAPSNDCFGVRKSSGGGSQVWLNGSLVKVWCTGILASPDEQVPNGEITYGPEPTCAELAADGYVALLNQNCYGKFFDPDQYYIECKAGQLLPDKLIALNGAEPVLGISPSPIGFPTDQAAADAIFNLMQQLAAALRQLHFGH